MLPSMPDLFGVTFNFLQELNKEENNWRIINLIFKLGVT
jgi:hypothetical protein